MRVVARVAACVTMSIAAIGCSSAKLTHTGFLSDYTKLAKAESGTMRYVSPSLRDYNAFIVDPVQIRAARSHVTAEQRAEVARYMRDTIARVLSEGGLKVATDQGVGVARLRVAITDVQDSKWYLNIHPATSVTGTGRGGASMEAEVIDSITGEQVAAVVRTGASKRFELNPFSTLDDVKNVIDQWAKDASDRLRELRASRKS